MTGKALVSVVIPAWNAARTIDATLASARAQTHGELEILLVDDGSSDATVAIGERHAIEDPRVRVLRKPNGGVADARNHGLRACRGAFVAPLDADDLWHPTKIAKQLAALDAAGPGATYAYCLSYLVDEADRVIGAVGFDGFAGDVFLRSLVLNFVGNGSAMLIRREAIDRIGGFDVSGQAMQAHGSEEMVVQSLLAALGPVAVASEWLVGYRRTTGSISANRDRMARAQKWHVDRVKAAVPDLADGLVARAHAGVDARMAVELARRGAPGPALRAAAAAVGRAPGHALAVMGAYGARLIGRALRRLGGASSRSVAAPLFADVDPTAGARWAPSLPFPTRLRRLAAQERAFAERLRARGLAGLTPLGLGPAA